MEVEIFSAHHPSPAPSCWRLPRLRGRLWACSWLRQRLLQGGLWPRPLQVRGQEHRPHALFHPGHEQGCPGPQCQQPRHLEQHLPTARRWPCLGSRPLLAWSEPQRFGLSSVVGTDSLWGWACGGAGRLEAGAAAGSTGGFSRLTAIAWPAALTAPQGLPAPARGRLGASRGSSEAGPFSLGLRQSRSPAGEECGGTRMCKAGVCFQLEGEVLCVLDP